MTRAIPISVHMVSDAAEVRYKIRSNTNESITISTRRVSRGKYSYGTDRYSKTWTYPKYAIIWAVKHLGGRRNIANVEIWAKTSLHVNNLRSVIGETIQTTKKSEHDIITRRLERSYPALRVSAGTNVKTKDFKPINIRGVIYRFYAVASGAAAAQYQTTGLQNRGFKVLTRRIKATKNRPEHFRIYIGPKRRS